MKVKILLKLFYMSVLMLSSLGANSQMNTAAIPDQYWQKNEASESDVENSWLYKHGDNQGSVYLLHNGFSYVHSATTADTLYQHRVDVLFSGMNNEVQIESINPINLPIHQYTNGVYIENASLQYTEVHYKNVYHLIDVIFKIAPSGNVKYEFVVHPGADPAQINLNYNGFDHLNITNDGGLNLKTSLGNIVEPKPISFYSKNHNEQIHSTYLLEGSVLKFDLAYYDKKQSIVVDPEIKWSTFFGGNSNDLGQSMAIGANESIYVCGSTSSSNFPSTTGASQISLQGLEDAFIYKLNKNGQLKWATYFGGLSIDKAADIALSGKDDVYITGVTSSINLKVSIGAIQLGLSGGTDAFLAKFDSTGVLKWSTYYGGTSDDEGRTVAVDDDGYVYAGGNTQSASLKISAGAFQTAIGGGSDGFISKFTSNGKAVWSTFLGGSQGDELTELTIDSNANLFLLGRTSSSNFPITSNVFQLNLGGDNDIFVAQFDSSGSRKWATYLGGSLDEYPGAISISENNLIHVVGGTESNNFPLNNATQSSYGGGLLDGFFTSISLNGQLKRSTYIGGSDIDNFISVHSKGGFTYLIGLSGSNSLPVSSHAYQHTKNSGLDGYFLRYDSLGTRVYASYFGGNADERLNKILEHRGTALWTGYSRSSNYPTSSGAMQTSNAGANDVVTTSFCEGFNTNNISLNGQDTGLICSLNPIDSIIGDQPNGWYQLGIEWQEDKGNGWVKVNNANTFSYYPGYTKGTVKLRRILSYGICTDTSNTLLIKVAPSPNIDFSFSGANCTNRAIQFIDNTSIKSGSLSFLWKFGDGDTSTLRNPVHTYGSVGKRTVKLYVESDSGCVATKFDTININPSPSSNFIFNNNCNRDSVAFIDNSTISSGNYAVKWYLGNGDSSNSSSFKYKFATEGIYLVKHVVASDSGCVDSSSRIIFIDSVLKANFGFNKICGVDTVQFKNKSLLSTGNITYLWNFGDGTTSQLANPSHFYAKPGSYQVRLKLVSDSTGCVDSLTRLLRINPRPRAGFSLSPVCGSLRVDFLDTSSIASGNLSSTFYFGDGNQSTSTKASHTYAQAGQYTVQLITISDSGCIDSTRQVISVDSVLKANFQISDDCERQKLVISNTSNVSGSNVSYFWDFGNGTSSSLKNPSIKYTKFGKYNVKLVLTSAAGCSDSITKITNIFSKPIAGFASDSKCNSLDVNVVDTTKISNGTYTLKFYFGDGNTVATLPTTHTYSQPGRYIQSLVTKTNQGCTDSVSYPVFIDTTIVANFSPVDVCFGDSIHFDNISSVSGSNIIYKWSFGDGTFSTKMNPRHFYSNYGSYSVKLVVASKAGCSDSIVRTVNVIPKPNAKASYNRSCQTDSVSFFGRSSGMASSRYIYQWSLGDGNRVIKDSFDYKYANVGSYQVKLTIIPGTAVGCRDSQFLTVKTDSILKASFDVIDSCENESINFVNTSKRSSGKINYIWNFSDGSKSLKEHPSRNFKAGTFSAQLIVIASTGCVDTFSAGFEVYDQPRANFDVFDNCKSLEASFQDASTDISNGADYKWNFDDGSTSTALNPKHIYNSAGTYKVKLLLASKEGCLDSITKTVDIDSGLVADFLAQSLCNEDPTKFINTSHLNSGSIQYHWTFGDGGTSELASPLHQYTLGTYSAKMVIYSSNGCEDSLTKQLVIEKTPAAAFTADTACFGTPVNFIDGSSAKGNSLAEWEWTFGTGDKDTQQNTTYTYANGGRFNVRLVVTSNKNCTDTASKQILQPDQLAATIVEQDKISCYGLADGRIKVSASGGLGHIQYQWNTNNSDTSNEIDNLTAGTYTLTMTDSFACVNQQSFLVDEPEPLLAKLSDDRIICKNQKVEIRASTQGGTAPFTYNWFCSQSNCEIDADKNERIEVSPSNSTTYWAVLKDSAGCQGNSDSVIIQTESKPQIEVKDTVKTLAGKSITLLANGDKTLNYQWLPKELIDGNNKQAAVDIAVDQSTLFTVSARRDSGCASLDSVWVWVLKDIRIPTSFTPNSDGYNDLWVIENIELYPDVDVRIYNRLGRELYSSLGGYSPWDGKKGDKPLPAGAYFYVVELNTGADALTGSVTILK